MSEILKIKNKKSDPRPTEWGAARRDQDEFDDTNEKWRRDSLEIFRKTSDEERRRRDYNDLGEDDPNVYERKPEATARY